MSSNRLVELRDSLEALRAEVAELADKDILTEDEEARFDGAVAEFEAAQAELAKAEERAAKVEQIRTAPVREPAQAPTVIVRSHKDIFDLSEIRALEPRAAKAELRARALDAIESAPEHMSHDARETATRHAEKNPAIAEHILRNGSPEYHEAFEDYLRTAGTNPVLAEQRAAMSLTAANGGVTVPFTLDPTLIYSNDGSVNPFRDISRVVTITTNSWNGVSSAGVSAEWLAEATEAADASPTFTQPSITAHKAAAYLQASMEVLMDSATISSEIGSLMADAKNRLEATAFATGSGSGQPKGIATVISLTTASRVAGSSGAAGAADLVAADIYALDNALPPRHRGNATFVGSRTVLNKIRQLGTADAYHAFWVDFGGATPPQLIGYNVRESSAMDSTIVSGSNDEVLVLGDFSNYVIVDRVGMTISTLPLVIGSNRRPTGETGFFAAWRVGGDSVNANAFRGLRL